MLRLAHSLCDVIEVHCNETSLYLTYSRNLFQATNREQSHHHTRTTCIEVTKPLAKTAVQQCYQFQSQDTILGRCHSPSVFKICFPNFNFNVILLRDKWVPVTTAWRVPRLRMEELSPDMEGSCEYTEKAVADSRQEVILQLGCWARC